MRRHRHTPEEAVRKLREGERLLNEGTDLAEVLRHLEVSEATWGPADGSTRDRDTGDRASAGAGRASTVLG